MLSYDIVIVGASFSGLTLAHHLPRHLRVLIVDSKPSAGSTVESTGLITIRTRDLFSSFVNIDRFITNPITSLCVMAPGWDTHFFSHMATPWIYQTDTRALIQHLSQTLPSNVTFLPATTFVGIDDPSHVTRVTLLSGGTTDTVATRFLVGADGGRSRVASSIPTLDITKRFLYGVEQVFLGEITLGDHPAHTIYHVWFGAFSLGYGGWLSPTTHEGKPAVRIGLAKHAKDRGEASELLKRFTHELFMHGHITFDGNHDTPVYQFGGMIPLDGAHTRMTSGNVLLIGDAAGLCGAFAADGIKGSLVSAMESAPLIAQAISGNKQALTELPARIDAHDHLMHYYTKQVRYRWIWDRMKRDSTFRAMYNIIEQEKDSFLLQFCDSREKKQSLARVVLKWKHAWKLFVYAICVIRDLILGSIV